MQRYRETGLPAAGRGGETERREGLKEGGKDREVEEGEPIEQGKGERNFDQIIGMFKPLRQNIRIEL